MEKSRREKEKKKYTSLINKYDQTLSWVEKKNKEIKKIQDKELKKIFVEEEKKKKIKLLRRRNDESSDEEINDEDSLLTILINPTLQSYIPLSQISISFEHKLLNKDENLENDKINSKEEKELKD